MPVCHFFFLAGSSLPTTFFISSQLMVFWLSPHLARICLRGLLCQSGEVLYSQRANVSAVKVKHAKLIATVCSKRKMTLLTNSLILEHRSNSTSLYLNLSLACGKAEWVAEWQDNDPHWTHLDFLLRHSTHHRITCLFSLKMKNESACTEKPPTSLSPPPPRPNYLTRPTTAN